MKSSGYILFLILIVLLILSSLSLSLFKINRLESKAEQHYSESLDDFYHLEQCLGNARQLLAHQKILPIVLSHCHSLHCVNSADPHLVFRDQSLSWWQQNGLRCDANHWEYWEFLQRNDETQRHYYRVTVFDQRNHCLQATFELNTNRHTVTSLAWGILS